MSIKNLNDAILSHRAWVARFRSALKFISTETFDIEQARDDTACNFGKWLYSDAADAIKPDSFERIMVLHKTFHEIAGDIAVMLQENRSHDEIEDYVAEFDNLSKQLVTLLMLEKSNMGS